MTRKRIRDIVVCVLLIVVVWVFYNANRKETQELNRLDRVILKISEPLDRAFSTVFAAWIGVWKKYLYLVDLKAENTTLLQENGALAANNRFLAAAAARGRQLARFRAYMEDSSAEMLAANVVRRRIDTKSFRVVGIVIDLRWGEVACGAPVVTPQGVVGRVLYFGLPDGDRIKCPVAHSLRSRRLRRKYRGRRPKLGRAMVQLTVDPGSRIDVHVPRSGARGMLRGLGWDRGYVAHITYLGPRAKVVAGDLVVTTGVDGRFPAGLPVGRVVSVTRQAGQDLKVVVMPTVDFGKLTRVLVVVSPPPPPVPRIRHLRGSRLGISPYP